MSYMDEIGEILVDIFITNELTAKNTPESTYKNKTQGKTAIIDLIVVSRELEEYIHTLNYSGFRQLLYRIRPHINYL